MTKITIPCLVQTKSSTFKCQQSASTIQSLMSPETLIPTPAMTSSTRNKATFTCPCRIPLCSSVTGEVTLACLNLIRNAQVCFQDEAATLQNWRLAGTRIWNFHEGVVTDTLVKQIWRCHLGNVSSQLSLLDTLTAMVDQCNIYIQNCCFKLTSLSPFSDVPNHNKHHDVSAVYSGNLRQFEIHKISSRKVCIWKRGRGWGNK